MLLFLPVDALLSFRVTVEDEFCVARRGFRFDGAMLHVGKDFGQSFDVSLGVLVGGADPDDFDGAVTVCAAEPIVPIFTPIRVGVRQTGERLR